MPGPLSNIKVLDFTHARAGPQSTMMMGDLGANVIKIERPGGEIGRAWGPTYEGERIDFMSVNRNKRSIELDLTLPADVELAHALAADADVLVQNLRPGVMSSFGLGASELLAKNPSLIYCSINGYGPDGPLALEPSYDNVIQAYSGLMSITGTDASGPIRSGLPLADLLTGVFAAFGILAALHERNQSGLGQHVQVSLLQSLINLMSFHGLTYLLTGKTPGLVGNHHPIMAPTGLYPVSDGHIVIQVSNDREWQRLCKALALDELANDERFVINDARVANRELMNRLINEKLAQRTRAEWIALLRAVRVPAGAVNSVAEALDDPQVRANDMVINMDHPVLGSIPALGYPARFGRTPCEIRLHPPELGEHTEEVRNARHF
ncbi:CoA transferase [Caballeronia sp. dw_19]|uniref:CaiB/BaiF CoA transferase family protein n=1 Tax=Caballeronia sp. dw_19 TaxID=2719791 RepID=UPI001BD50888|nr:CoA transferase [Caballeronia sp. dw_19]